MAFSTSQHAIVPAIFSILYATIARLIVNRNYPKYIKTNNVIFDPPKYLTCSDDSKTNLFPFYANCKSESRQDYEKLAYTFIIFVIISVIFIKSGSENYAVKALRSIGFSQKRSKKRKKSRRRANK